ncbi:MAG: M23 family metallopeptidase [bacterium]
MKRFWPFLALAAILLFFAPFVLSGCGKQEVPTQSSFLGSEPDSSADDGSLSIALDNGYINTPITPWLPLGGYAFGRYVSGRGYHLGDDCVRSPGKAVHAIWHGRVKYARYNSGGWGYLMIVEYYINNLPFCVVYGHLGGTMYPGEGNWVTRGQYIGTVGSTQESGQTTPHLHLGIHYGGYGAPTGTYPSWCKGYASSTSGWFNPTDFMNYW